ncbi:hypothetical protein PHYPSEUDO_012086 [Phytophthora pseudosyringae]|uniref:Uncharacterized protein n=1 Tax=Phytophthora pseudosyringae TaxID=221518 RepID=A0A8T1W5C9_9STRA|nr:hypothetical protein PHYPSEUDO_012086 [Phytophthora pseudosyringae]
MPPMLTVYAAILFFELYSYSDYTGNKGEFFGLVEHGGSATNADTCKPVQTAYNYGVSKASGLGDLLFNSMRYMFSWILPLLALLMAMAFCSSVGFDLFVVAILSVAQSAHGGHSHPRFGGPQRRGHRRVRRGAQLGELLRSAAQLRHWLGPRSATNCQGFCGAMSFLGFLVGAFLYKAKMHSM